MTYQRTTATQRKAIERAATRYLHVSVLVGTEGGQPTRTEKGKGATARKNPDVEKIIHIGRHRRELRRKARSAD